MVRYHILPLERAEIRDYINHRLHVAGLTREAIEFNEESVMAISDFSNGTPRLINMICDRALLAGFSLETNKINGDIICKCLEELNSYVAEGHGV